MATEIPEGFALVPSRGRDTAIALLKAADDAGVDQTTVRTVFEGFLVPEAVIDHYTGDELEDGEVQRHGDEPEVGPTGDEKFDADAEAAGITDGQGDAPSPGTEARAVQEAGQQEAAPEPVKAPAKSASKGAWVDFAVSQGAEREEAESATQADLIERYGSAE